MSYAEIEMKVVQWGEARGIVQNSKPMAQAIKTLEETTELLAAINKRSLPEAKDAIGDIVVTLIMVCAILDVDLVDCLHGAYNEIKDRKGHLRPDGVFVKETANTAAPPAQPDAPQQEHRTGLWGYVDTQVAKDMQGFYEAFGLAAPPAQTPPPRLTLDEIQAIDQSMCGEREFAETFARVIETTVRKQFGAQE
jgi:NTP pyrophosphatase (non-canonical NTP hydrolase)